MCDLLHQPSCVPHRALLQDTAPPPPPPAAAPPAMRPSVGQHQEYDQAWVACSRYCFLPSSTDCLVMLPCLNGRFWVLSVIRIQTTFNMRIYTSSVLTFMSRVVHQLLCPDHQRLCSAPSLVERQQQRRLHHQPAAAQALIGSGRVFPLCCCPPRCTNCLPTHCLYPLKVIVFSPPTCLYFRPCPMQ